MTENLAKAIEYIAQARDNIQILHDQTLRKLAAAEQLAGKRLTEIERLQTELTTESGYKEAEIDEVQRLVVALREIRRIITTGPVPKWADAALEVISTALGEAD